MVVSSIPVRSRRKRLRIVTESAFSIDQTKPLVHLPEAVTARPGTTCAWNIDRTCVFRARLRRPSPNRMADNRPPTCGECAAADCRSATTRGNHGGTIDFCWNPRRSQLTPRRRAPQSFHDGGYRKWRKPPWISAQRQPVSADSARRPRPVRSAAAVIRSSRSRRRRSPTDGGGQLSG